MTTNSIKVLCDLCFHLVVHAVVIALRIPVHSLHLDNVFILRIDSVGGVDVVLEGSAANPPLHNVARKKTECKMDVVSV